MGQPIIPCRDHLPEHLRPEQPPRPPPPPAGGAKREDPLRGRRLGWWNTAVRWRIGPSHLFFLCLQLRAHIEAGFPITEAWRLAAHSTNHLPLRALCRAVHRDLVAGRPLREALARHEGKIPRFFASMMASAERSGSYTEVIDVLQKHYSWLRSLKGEIVKAAFYPIAVLLLGLLVLTVAAWIIMGINQRGGDFGLPEDPVPTLLLMLWRAFWPALLAMVAAHALTTAMQRVRGLRRTVDALGLITPFIGALIKRHCAANFCRMYATMSAAGAHPSVVYRDAAASMGNTVLERRVLRWQRFVDEGEPVTEALRRAGILPLEMLATMEVAEHTASSDTVLPRVADLIALEVRNEMRAVAQTLVPAAPFLIALCFFGAGLLANIPLVGPFLVGQVFYIVLFVLFFLVFLI